MKRLLLSIICFAGTFTLFSQNVGIGTTSPAASAQLDVTSTNKGFLPPRVSLTSTTDVATIAAPATGLLVYNTNTAGISPTNVLPGYYYYTGLAWSRLSNNGNALGDIQYWNGSQWVNLPAGTQGQNLTICGGIPQWGPCAATSLATVNTTATTAITGNSATCSGNVLTDGGTTVTARGICYSLSPSPTIISGTVVPAGAGGTGAFSVSLTGLVLSTTYHVRAYATNTSGTAYGADSTFTTTGVAAVLPTVTTRNTSSVAGTTATSGGNVTADGGATVTARGVCYGTAVDPDLTNTVATAAAGGTGAYTVALTSLAPSTLYHIRAYATNSAGTAYGSDSTFTTTAITAPTVTTIKPFGVGSLSANSGGNVTSNGGTPLAERGIVYSTAANPDILFDEVVIDGSTTTGSFTGLMTPLLSNTTYHVRAYAKNSVGTSYGGDSTFTTLAAGAFAATYTFDSVKTTSGTTDPTAVPTATGATFGSFTSVGAAANPNTGFRFSFTGWTLGATNGLDVFSAIDSTIKYYEVTITPGAGKMVDLSSLNFKFQRSTTGTRQCFVRSSIDGYGANLPASIVPADANGSVVATNKFQLVDLSIAVGGCTITLGGGTYSNLTAPITFRFYGINAEASTGTFSIDDVVFNGTIH